MENNNDKKHFESAVYGQRESNQDTEKQVQVSGMRNKMRTCEIKEILLHACAGQHQTRGWRRQSAGPWHFRLIKAIVVYCRPGGCARG